MADDRKEHPETNANQNGSVLKVEEELGRLIAQNPDALGQILSDLSKRPDQAGIIARVSTAMSWDGPLPPPQLLREYEEVYPGLSKIIIDKFEAAHRRADKEQEFRHSFRTRGQWAMIVFVPVALGVAAYCAFLGLGVAAAVIGAAAFGTPALAYFKKVQAD